MIQAKKRFSQNFLHDKAIIHQIVQAMAVQPSDKLLEIGPGMGALTEALATQCESLLALEIDRDLVALLQPRFAKQKHITIKHQDAMSFAYHDKPPYRLVSNLPYHLSTALIRKFITQGQSIIDMHLMMQKEVAQRLLATSGKARGWLSVMIELLCEAEYLFDVSPESFQPIPAVHSAVIRLQCKDNSPYSQDWLHSFQAVLIQAFSQKRKTLWNNFVPSQWKLRKEDWEAIGINPSLRAEQVDLTSYIKLNSYVINIANK